jgi:hypothetical protein
MTRDIEDEKVDYTNLLHGPMLKRWAEHLTKAKSKYPDVEPGIPNWTLAAGPEELARFKRSALRHLIQYLQGDRDEDHLAATMFNLNGAAYVEDKMTEAPRLLRLERNIEKYTAEDDLMSSFGEYPPDFEKIGGTD